MEDNIRKRLLKRGFTEKNLINNRGLISATIEDTLIEYIVYQHNKMIDN